MAAAALKLSATPAIALPIHRSENSSRLVSEVNRDVYPALPGEFKSLRIGNKISVYPPVISAPMAGVSSAPYRLICAEMGAPICTSEMVIASTLLQKNKESQKIVKFHPKERVKSIQLYGVRPELIEQATSWLVHDNGAEHVDLNFGCPVPKITRKGGGAALPLRPKLFGRLVGAAVQASRGVAPVTVKMRIGVNDDLKTCIEAGKVAEAEGAVAITLHARTAEQGYAPSADWDVIGELAAAVRIPVIGNGDIYEAADALRMMRATNCAGVMIGRGALGRPWLFSELCDMFGGRYPRPPLHLGAVLDVATKHLTTSVEWEKDELEKTVVMKMRKMLPLYLHGFTSASRLLVRLMAATSMDQWHTALATVDYDPLEPFPASALRFPRMKGANESRATSRHVPLPENWLQLKDTDELPTYMTDMALQG